MTGAVAVLESWDGWRVRAAGAAASRRAEDLRSLAEAVAQQAEQAPWTGAAARAHRLRAEELHAQLCRVAEEVELLSDALRLLGQAVCLAGVLLQRGRAIAASAGLQLGPDGSVRVPPGADDHVLSAGLGAQAMALEALAAAHEADRDAAAPLQAVPGLPGGLLGALAGSGLLAEVSGRALPAPGTAPEQVAAWWWTLPPQVRRGLEREPALGALDGLPAAVRDRANRAALDAVLGSCVPGRGGLWAVLRGDLRAARRDARQVEVALAVAAQLARVPGAQLLAFDPGPPGTAVIAVGDVDSAAHVALLVPGLNARVVPALGGYVGDALRLRDRATGKGAGSVATVAWLGYQAPGFRAVVTDDRARQGAGPLRLAVRGLDAQATAGLRDAHLTVSGHSYGSLVAGIALRERTGADELVLLGSPGIGAERVGELWVPPAHVFVAETGTDVVADLSRFGADPSDDRFGARQLQTDGRSDPVLGRLGRSGGHTHYYDEGSESLDNLALVVVGRSELASYD